MRKPRAVIEKLHAHLPALLIVMLALALRLVGLTRHSLWVDEGFSIYVASHPLPQLIAGTVADQHPPLYYMLLRGLMLSCGQGEAVVRGFSVLLGTGNVLLLSTVGRRLFSPRVGQLAALALALSPAHIWHSQEARMYALLALLLTASAYLAWRTIEEPGTGTWGGYVLVTIAALYTHYFSLFVVLFENLLLVPLAMAGGKQKRLGPWLAAQGCLLLGFAPWIPVIVYQVRYHQPVWIGYASWDGLAEVILFLATGPWWNGRPLTVRLTAWLWLALLSLGTGLAALRGARNRRPALFTWGWFLLPLATIFVLSHRWRLFQPKQFLFLLPPLFLLVGLGMAGLSRAGRILSQVVFIALLLPGLHTTYFRLEKQEWRELARYIDQESMDGDCIFLSASPGALTLNYYLQSELPQDAYPFPYDVERGGYEGEVATVERVTSRLSPLAARCRRIWSIDYSNEFWDPQHLIRTWMEAYGRPLPVPSFYGLDVRLYQKAEGP